LKGYIENEKYELERDILERARQAERLAGRFGVDLLGSEEEALAYAALLSQESLEEEKRRKDSEKNRVSTRDVGTKTATPVPSIPEDETLDADIAEAIRLSLQESPVEMSPSGFDIPIKYAKGVKSPTKRKNKAVAEPSPREDMSDLEFALQLSLAEEQSRKEAAAEVGFPPLSPGPSSGYEGKGKGRMQ
jgi:hypothetical protein